MNLNVDGKEFKLTFAYFYNDEGRRVTKCSIYRNYTSPPPFSTRMAFLISTGEATCSEKDNFCKETGRRLAFMRARDKVLDRQSKELNSIWDKFDEKRGKKVG